MAIKSLLTTAQFTKAQREHACRANKKHKIIQNDIRLEIKNGRNWDRYCLECAEKILDKANSDLEVLRSQFPS